MATETPSHSVSTTMMTSLRRPPPPGAAHLRRSQRWRRHVFYQSPTSLFVLFFFLFVKSNICTLDNELSLLYREIYKWGLHVAPFVDFYGLDRKILPKVALHDRMIEYGIQLCKIQNT